MEKVATVSLVKSANVVSKTQLAKGLGATLAIMSGIALIVSFSESMLIPTLPIQQQYDGGINDV